MRLWNVTAGSGVSRVFQRASGSRSVLDVRNFLLLGDKLPAEAAGPSNLAADASWFVNASAHEYQLAAGAPAVDAGEAYDVGAYERLVATGRLPPPAAPQNFRIIRAAVR